MIKNYVTFHQKEEISSGVRLEVRIKKARSKFKN